MLESLRHSFWNDSAVTEPLQQPQFAAPVEESPMSPSKRVRESDDDDDNNNMSESESRPPVISKKRARLTTPQGKHSNMLKGIDHLIHILYCE